MKMNDGQQNEISRGTDNSDFSLEQTEQTIDRRSAALPRALHLLDLPQSRRGFRYFICSWFFTDDLGRRVLVDPGPAGTVPLLFDKLGEFTDDVDLILLTHIHLDHSGGIGQVCERCRNAKILAHPKAGKYLTAPERLWKSSLEVLGDVAEMYGAPVPLPAGTLLQEPPAGVTVLKTPGHAPHHLSFIVSLGGERLVFVGEAAGLFLPPPEGSPLPYLRPTTPPKFDCDAARSSLDTLASALRGDEILCYSHWGVSRQAREQVYLAKGQIEDWLSIISGMRDQPEDAIADYLFANDKFMRGISRLPEDLWERERYFVKNSVEGFLGYIRDKEGKR
jgi:glyoxylase-like metal-dependent hydrolase (beta-lactamase superfamily II)